MNTRKKIWIHLANSPHVLVFRPIIAALQKRGYQLYVTARDFAQTIPLAQQYGVAHEIVETHAGGSLLHKGTNLLTSALNMMRWAWGRQIDIALSHNSYSHALASHLLRIPFVTMMDYEFQAANHLAFRLAKRVLVPACLPDDTLAKLGAKQYKLRKYDGFKEQLYLSDFAPNPAFPEHAGIERDKVLVVLRTPATMALYHQFDNPLFKQLIQYIAYQPNTTMLVLPRTEEQAQAIRGMHVPNLRIPQQALDGPNLLYYADMVISAGGTMNREAAILGVPTYTIYAGQIGAVDRMLTSAGRIQPLSCEEDFRNLVFVKRNRDQAAIHLNHALLDEVLSYILEEDSQ